MSDKKKDNIIPFKKKEQLDAEKRQRVLGNLRKAAEKLGW